MKKFISLQIFASMIAFASCLLAVNLQTQTEMSWKSFAAVQILFLHLFSMSIAMEKQLQASVSSLLKMQSFHQEQSALLVIQVTKKGGNGYFAAEVLSKAVQNLHAGDTLVLKDGHYAGCVELKNLCGSPDNYITIKAENKGKAVVHGVTADTGKAVIKLRNCSYIKIDGLELCDAVSPKSSKGVHITPPSHHIAVTNCHFTNIKSTIPAANGSAHGVCIWGDDADCAIHDILIKGNTFDNMATE